MPAILTALFAVAAALCLVRLLLVKRTIRGLTAQLRSYNDGESAAKVSIDGPDRGLEALAIEINRHTDLVVQAVAERKRTEDELRQAVANISHDLRTPLTSISGYMQLLGTSGLTDGEREEALAVIRKRTERLQSLLNDFYELAMTDSTDYTLKPARVRLDKLIPEILMGYYDQLQARGLEPSFELPLTHTEIWADESAVRRVAENLIVNAIRHATGKLAIRLSSERGRVVFALSNNAPHLRGTDTNLLFNRFYMADQARSGSSSGLGLSIARGLMDKMGGSLAAEMNGDVLSLCCEWRPR
ncbi:sensor histidine kinase [Cohnella sp. 56]|uniref:sensor histidine kinase n=1 Tax=Cohnella sp. 56 TaxID=3113722 RepID=UPI0030E8D2A4